MPFLPPRLTLVERRKWRTPQFGVILVRGLDRPTLTPVRRSAEGVASRRPTCESQAQSYAPQGAPLTLRYRLLSRGLRLPTGPRTLPRFVCWSAPHRRARPKPCSPTSRSEERRVGKECR